MELLLKTQKECKRFKETGDDMAYGDFKDLPRRTAADKVLRDKAFNIPKNPKYGRYQRGLTSMVYKFFGKKSFGSNTSGGAVKS